MYLPTLPEVLKQTADQYPDLGIFFIQDDGNAIFQSYPELLQEATAMGAGLAALGFKQGDKVIIATSTNQATVKILWACFLIGVVPTILQPPVSFTDYNPAASKLINVFRQLEFPGVFISGNFQTQDGELRKRLIHVDDIPSCGEIPKVQMNAEDLAFIQYSSGSTGDPKGIMLNHSNLYTNIRAIISGLDLQAADHGGNWMPLYHDMGLIGYHLTPVYCPCNQYHIETMDFIKNPGLWLEMLDKYRISVTGSPNFGQALVLRYLKRKSQQRDWDFSAVKALLNGAEPISFRIMDDFIRHMKEHGFREEAMMPVYGMAEATLAISFSKLLGKNIISHFDSEVLDQQMICKPIEPGKQGKSSRTFISVGNTLQDVAVKIVNELGEPIPENQVGHILVSGKSVTAGYYKQPEATRQSFEDGWLKTGDMGFYFEANLYISGRSKDILFLNGKNFFANDLEQIACTLEDISYGKIVFGGITDPKTSKEKILVFISGISEAAAPDLWHRLRVLFRKKLGIHLDELILLKSNEIPKTSSGKIERYKILQRYSAGQFRDRRVK